MTIFIILCTSNSITAHIIAFIYNNINKEVDYLFHNWLLHFYFTHCCVVEIIFIVYPQIFNGPDTTQGIAAELGLVNWPAATLVDAAGVVVKTGESAAEIWSFLDANLPK